ncbi:MAG: hypothetical protein OIF40_09000 [Mangrovicoccus sp.]|nr:hypothetical protein [Mangrovicoccus sp.]
MPRASGVIGALRAAAWGLAIGFGLMNGAARAQDCAPDLRVSAGQDGLVTLQLAAPCGPYERVDVIYGPFLLTEETDGQGQMLMRLPPVVNLPNVAAVISEQTLFAPMPLLPGPSPDYVALVWEGDVDFALSLPGEIPGVESLKLGFPIGAEAHRAHILVMPSGSALPGAVNLAHQGRPCALAPVRASVISSQSAARMPLRLPAPGCDGDGFVRIPVPGAG